MIFVRIYRIRDEIQYIDEFALEKELVIVALLGLPKYWSSFASGVSSWKDTPTFQHIQNVRSQEEASIPLVSNKNINNEEENTSNVYYAHHKKKGAYKKFKGPKNKGDLSKIECYNCDKMGHYKSQYLENRRNKKTKR